MTATTKAVQRAAQDALDAIEELANVVLSDHGEYLGTLASRAAMSNLDQVDCWLRMVVEQGRLS